MTRTCLVSLIRIVFKFKHKSRKSLLVTPACFTEDSLSAPFSLQWGPHVSGVILCGHLIGTGYHQ